MAEVIPDELVLAAIDRAVRHHCFQRPKAILATIKEHLGLPAHARGVRIALNGLVQAKQVELSKSGGVEWWELTAAGRKRLERARRADQPPELPESPQHQWWRKARVLSEQEIERFHLDLLDLHADLGQLLGVPWPPGPPSDAWFEISGRLTDAAWRLGSATYCLHEWAEPSDDTADVDELLSDSEDELDCEARTALMIQRQSRRDFKSWSWRRSRTPGALLPAP